MNAKMCVAMVVFMGWGAVQMLLALREMLAGVAI